ncbi:MULTISPECIES: STAS domain-containing protein [unclassified Streptomyces]|uniref:STAS domain-containing protein n=1 Tax=unclassified Streptomyces TaxID=2593676 RepID=UPI001151C855|nr:STAS domain-containing protein [Streptomyces sp. SLBN-31]TQJ86061.1 anti-anti-sigma factor [Streptomyces sp. SLBN-31]
MAEMHSDPPPPTVRVVAGRTVVALRGEIDLSTVPSLSARLDELTAGPRPDLVVDLRDVSFIDCSGLGMLCRTRNRVVAHEGRLRLVTDSPDFRRLLPPVGLADVFDLESRLCEAVAHTADAGDLARATG